MPADSTPTGAVLPPAGVAEKPQKLLAPQPIVDRYPIIIGQNLTLTYLASAYRLCNSGIRYPFVDCIKELLEHDPHARGVVRQRVLGLAGARLEVHPAKLPKNDPEVDLAKEIAEEVQRQFEAMPSRAQALGGLAWGGIFGASGSEIEWRKKGTAWEARRLHFIHSRRLNDPDPSSWDIHVWVQGSVTPIGPYMGVTTGMFGLRCADFPGKFVIHTPQLSGDYPTRDGEARYIATYLALKRTIVRATAQDFERTIRPWVLGYFGRQARKEELDVADKADVDKLEAAVKALGLGSLSGAVLPDCVRIEILRAASNLDPKQFVEWIDQQVTKSILGQTFTTQPGKFGNRNAAEMAKAGTMEVLRYDAQCLSDSLEQDLVYWIVRLNYPSHEERLCPTLKLVVEELPDPEKVMRVATEGATIDLPIDADWLAGMTGLTLVAKDDEDARRTRLVKAADAAPENGEEPEGDPGDGQEDDAEDDSAPDDEGRDDTVDHGPDDDESPTGD